MGKVKITTIGLILVLAILCRLCISDTEEHPLGRGFNYSEYTESIYYWRYGDSLHFSIPPRVLSYDNRWSSIIIKQQPELFDDPMFSHYDYPYGRDSVYYWYINKKSKEITGPVLYSEMECFLEEKGLEGTLKKL